ncbi:Crp/Fnr family transcriptional regulator [Clostridium gasigenes]|uniref:Crp/Fnr family transcriptional regulator n=1 Tax=Clostridium gasigenes TaxID=94869 RepID=UPI00143845DC|nr:Crp/Fnr family transcriptional regulator [Clostridium gasigenes]MBU3131183.1 Crp/Fnr family transcriptional regulator [Clostridium gasigenes]NKF08648.1 Crp/Fnr family transcriptional regulator [Clostridium gasigenes]QSW18434.1 Crp/Fnr family transcriptional regulator [Clostridium gasigenes]
MNLCNNCCPCNHKYCAKKVSLFASLSDNDLNKVVNLITKKSFEKGDIIFSEGELFDKLFIINNGSIKIYTYTKDGKEQILYILKEGEFLGDLNLLKNDIFKFNAMALESTNMCIIHKDDFDILIKTNPEISIKILEYAHDRIASLENLVQTLTTKDVEVRLASLLINLSSTFGIKTDIGIEITLPLTREDMANFIGVTRETVSRKLSYFQSQNIIEIFENKIILIKDITILKELVKI